MHARTRVAKSRSIQFFFFFDLGHGWRIKPKKKKKTRARQGNKGDDTHRRHGAAAEAAAYSHARSSRATMGPQRESDWPKLVVVVLRSSALFVECLTNRPIISLFSLSSSSSSSSPASVYNPVHEQTDTREEKNRAKALFCQKRASKL